jgi:predicted small secreted protein
MKKNAFAVIILVVLIAVAMASCGTASSMKKGRVGCPSTRYSIGY